MPIKKLTEDDILKLRASKRPPAQDAAEYNISEWYVYAIRAGRARNPGDYPVKPPRHLNQKADVLDDVGCCGVCGIKLHKQNFTTNGDGHLIEVCDRGHRMISS